MYEQQTKSWFKHLDFMVLDLLSLILGFAIAYWVIEGPGNPFDQDRYQYQAILLLLGQLIVILFTNNYTGILRRGYMREFAAVLRNVGAVFLLVLVYLFLVHQSSYASRLQLGFTFVFFTAISYIVRLINKARILKFNKDRRRSLAIITTRDLALEVFEDFDEAENYHDYFISGVILLDADSLNGAADSHDVPIMRLGEEAIANMSHGWVDEVLIIQPEDTALPKRLMDDLMVMGMTVNYTSSAMGNNRWPVTDVRSIGDYRVLTSGIRQVSFGQIVLKRLLDFVGALVGCLITLILYLFVAPAIRFKSPGPVFFKQDRVGLNGKVFKMYKFRSMYLDAEERKAELLEQNKVSDGMMFKMEDDPRIIGSEKKGPNGEPRGIGNFIRKTSIDEFPQFFNVLKGDMSLVGTRPPTLDEWEKYDLGHRARVSIKPGITGLWQVSGRSEITDFREVVRLDREYIEKWSVGLDLKILVRTVGAVLFRRGAE